MNKIKLNLLELASDPYGNYAITEMIKNWDSNVCLPVFKEYVPKINKLSV